MRCLALAAWLLLGSPPLGTELAEQIKPVRWHQHPQSGMDWHSHKVP